MGGKNREIEAEPEESPQKSNLTTSDITMLLHNHLWKKVGRAREARNQKINESTQLINQYNNIFEQEFWPLSKEYNEISMEIFNLKAKVIEIAFNLFNKTDDPEIKKLEEDISISKSMGLFIDIEKDELDKEFSILTNEEEILKRIKKIFKKSTEAIDDIPLLHDRLIATEKLTKEEIKLTDRGIQLLNSDIKLLHKRIAFYKKRNEFLEKEKALLNKTMELHKKREEEKIYIYAKKEEKAQSAPTNNHTADTLRKKLCVKDKEKEDEIIYINAIRKMKEPDEREMERKSVAKVIEAIRILLYSNHDASSKSTGTKEMMEILNKEWNFEYEKDRNPELVFHKLVQCANKRMGFFQSWYSQSSFFGQGRKDWVHELYITLRYINKNKEKFSPDEAVSMFNNVKNRATAQKIKDNNTSSTPHNGR